MPYVREAVEIYEALHPTPGVTLNRGAAYYNLARALHDSGKKAAACPYWRLARRDLSRAEPTQPDGHQFIKAGEHLKACPAAFNPAAPRP